MFSNEDIIFEDNHLLIVNKKAGELVQADAAGEKGLEDAIKKFIKYRDSKPGEVFLGVIHRIDRPVSGVVIFAKTSKALARMNEAVKSRDIVKNYLAIVEKAPKEPSGMLEHYISRNNQKNRSYASTTAGRDGKLSQLKYEMVASSDRYFMLWVELITGRHHQIRCQLSVVGSPIKGDLKYGAARSNRDGSICLHAYSVEFTHPTTKERLTVSAPLPTEDGLWAFFNEAAENYKKI